MAAFVARVGDPDQFAFVRSSAKPFQLAPFVASGRFDEYRLGTEALAIMASSHVARTGTSASSRRSCAAPA